MKSSLQVAYENRVIVVGFDKGYGHANTGPREILRHHMIENYGRHVRRVRESLQVRYRVVRTKTHDHRTSASSVTSQDNDAPHQLLHSRLHDSTGLGVSHFQRAPCSHILLIKNLNYK